MSKYYIGVDYDMLIMTGSIVIAKVSEEDCVSIDIIDHRIVQGVYFDQFRSIVRSFSRSFKGHEVEVIYEDHAGVKNTDGPNKEA